MWAIIEKPELRDRYVSGRLYEDFTSVLAEINGTFNDFATDYIVVLE